VSPLATLRSPGAAKSAAEKSVPDVPPLVLSDVKNAPPTTVVPLMLNAAGEALFVITEGSAVVAGANVQVGRVALLYAVTSVQPIWLDIVSVAAGLLLAPAPYRPMYHVVI